METLQWILNILNIIWLECFFWSLWFFSFSECKMQNNLFYDWLAFWVLGDWEKLIEINSNHRRFVVIKNKDPYLMMLIII